MISDLRIRILLFLYDHSKSGSKRYVECKDLAAQLGCTVQEVRNQLDILENENKVILVKTSEPSYGTQIALPGTQEVEEIVESIKAAGKHPAGSKNNSIKDTDF